MSGCFGIGVSFCSSLNTLFFARLPGTAFLLLFASALYLYEIVHLFMH